MQHPRGDNAALRRTDMYRIVFSAKADKIIAKWGKSDPAKKKKLDKVLDAIAEDPRHGIGKPEPMVGGMDITYSRHITDHDRIVYDVYDEEIVVLVVQVEGHYNDK